MAAKVLKVQQLVSAKAAADLTGIPYTSLRDHALQGDIPIVKIGRAWYFKRADLARFIERQTECVRPARGGRRVF